MLGRGGGGGGSWRDSLRWAEGGGGCYTIAPGKAEHLQIPAAERGEHPIPSPPAGRAAAAEQPAAPGSSLPDRCPPYPRLPPPPGALPRPSRATERRAAARGGALGAGH